MNKEKRAFTLIELLVVIAILGILSSVLIASFLDTGDRARIAKYNKLDTNLKTTQSNQLIGEWLFDKASLVADDTSGYGNDGTIDNVDWIETGGFDGKGAYLWDDGSDSINLGRPAVLNPEKFTISMWIKPPKNAPADILALFSNTNQCCGTFYGYELNINKFSGGPWRTTARVWNGSATQNVREVLVEEFDGKWHHVVFTYDGEVIKFYWDGQKLGEQIYTNGVGNPAIYNTYIGGSGIWNGNRFGFNGIIDNVRMYSNVLLTQDINLIYAKESSQLINSKYASK